MTEPRCQVPSCPDFGDPDFGEATCPSWHADVTSPPVDAAGPSGPVGRSVGEIRADLARLPFEYEPPKMPQAAHRLLHDVEPLLAEVEAAHRFELAAGVEREALLAEVERLEQLVVTTVGAANASGRVVQAVESAAAEWQRNGWGSASDYDKGAQRVADEILSIMDHWRRGAVAAVRCPECNHQPGCACPDTPTQHGCQTCLAAAADAPQPEPKEQTMSTGVELIAAERQRQVEVEGWTPEHDAHHGMEALAKAAAAYATPAKHRAMTFWVKNGDRYELPSFWPWDRRYWKPTPDDRVRELVKAGALIAAEIDRLTRGPSPAVLPEESS